MLFMYSYAYSYVHIYVYMYKYVYTMLVNVDEKHLLRIGNDLLHIINLKLPLHIKMKIKQIRISLYLNMFIALCVRLLPYINIL